MENKNDGRRVRLTKMLLKSSLIEIMKTKSIHIISIKEICEGADVNRSTFYRHYNTQYDLYDDIIEDIAADMANIHSNYQELDSYSSMEFLTKVLEYIESNREMFLVILSDKGKISLGEAFTRFTDRFIDHEAMSDVGAYVTQFLAAGLTSTMWTWLNKDTRRSPKELASLLYSIIMHGLGRAMKYSANVKEYLSQKEEGKSEPAV